MSLDILDCGFVPLTDAAPLVVAREIGFAAEEGLDLRLHPAPSWATLRDRLAVGALDAAHMLAPMPLAMGLGLSGLPVTLAVPSLLSVNGTVIGLSRRLAERVEATGHDDPRHIGQQMIAAAQPLRIGVPFPFSMHVELLRYWFDALDIDMRRAIQIKTVPPAFMGDALQVGEIDAFCVGEPWGSSVVERGVGEIVLAGSDIWAFAPEKVLALRTTTCEDRREVVERLVRALWRAGAWLAEAENRMVAAELLSGPAYLGIGAEIIERVLHGTLIAAPDGRELSRPNLIAFGGAAMFPWRSQALWIARRIAARAGLDGVEADRVARACFRPDIARTALAPAGVDLPGASEKIEGALAERTAVASSRGTLFLGPDRFFDGQVFDPSP